MSAAPSTSSAAEAPGRRAAVVRWTALLGLAPLLAACGDNLPPRDAGGSDDAGMDSQGNPPMPALGEVFDRRGRPLTAELLIGVDLPPGAARDAAHAAFARANEYNWRTYELEMARAIAAYDALDSAASAGDGCGYQGTTYAALAAVFADDRLYVDTQISMCGDDACPNYFAVERSYIPPPRARQSCGGNALSYDVVDASYTALIKDPSHDVQVPPVSDGVERHGDVNNTAFPFLGREHR